MQWCKVKCDKCGKQFEGQYREGTEVFCNDCARWVVVGEEKKNDGGNKV